MTSRPRFGALNRPRALVTGGAGFLGSHICDRLVAEGLEVVCLDSLLTGSADNVAHLLSHPLFTFIQSDVTNPIDIEGHIDFILHLASPASPKHYSMYPIHTLKAGALGTYCTLELARAKGSIFLLASSSEVYGDPELNPQPESYWGHVNPVGPRSMYDEAKRFAEAISVAYHQEHGVDVRIARIFNTYGPRMRPDDGRVLPTFMATALKNEDIPVYGDGSQSRSFCYVDDMVEGLYRLALFKYEEKQVGQNVPTQRDRCDSLERDHGPLIVNLGNPEEVSILDLAREVIEVTGSRSSITFGPLPVDDPKVRQPDITRAKCLLKWEPLINRANGMRRLAQYFREALGYL